MVRKIHRCSLCNSPGHNARTCTKIGCLSLFGTNIYYEKYEDDQSMKVQRMGQETAGNYQNMNELKHFGFDILGTKSVKKGYQNKKRQEKPLIQWDEDEHKLLVAGLKWLGYGKWKAISTNFVTTRNPAQVASHAQKHFLYLSSRHENKSGKRRVFNLKFEDHDLMHPQGFPVSKGNNATTISSKSPFPTPSSPDATLLKKIAPTSSEASASSSITIAHKFEEGRYAYLSKMMK